MPAIAQTSARLNASMPSRVPTMERVRDDHAVPCGREGIAQARRPPRRRQRGRRASKECGRQRPSRRAGHSESTQPAERPLVVSPGLGRLARFHEEIGSCERQRHGKHDPRSFPQPRRYRSNGPRGRAGYPGGCNANWADGFVLDEDPTRIDPAAVHAFLASSYWAEGRERCTDGRSNLHGRARCRRHASGRPPGRLRSGRLGPPTRSRTSRTSTCWRSCAALGFGLALAGSPSTGAPSGRRSGSFTRATCTASTKRSASSPPARG